MIFRYLLKEIMGRFLVVLGSLYTVLLVSQVFRISSLISAFGFSIGNILEPLFYVSVTYLETLIPIAFFLAALTTVLKLSETEELTALLSSGKSLKQLSRPFVFCAFILMIASLWSANTLESWGKKKLLEFIETRTLGKIRSTLQQKMQEDVFIEIFRDYYLYADKVSENKSQYENVVLAPKKNKQGSNSFFISAERGESTGVKEGETLLLKFYNGTLYQLSSKSSEGILAMKFESFEVDFFTGIRSQLDLATHSHDTSKSKSSYEIYRTLRSGKKIPELEERKMKFLLYSRNFSPLLVLAFAFWGLVLGIYSVRQEKKLVFLSFFLVFFSSTALSSLLKWICETGYASPVWVVPMSYMSFTVFSFYALYKKDQGALWEKLRFF